MAINQKQYMLRQIPIIRVLYRHHILIMIIHTPVILTILAMVVGIILVMVEDEEEGDRVEEEGVMEDEEEWEKGDVQEVEDEVSVEEKFEDYQSQYPINISLPRSANNK